MTRLASIWIKLYAPDSTTIDLCLSLFPWVKCRRRKAAVKMHTLLDLHGNIPTFVRVTSGDVHDVNILDEIAIVRKRLGLAASLYQTLQILSVTLFENPPILCALQTSEADAEFGEGVNQLILFDI